VNLSELIIALCERIWQFNVRESIKWTSKQTEYKWINLQKSVIRNFDLDTNEIIVCTIAPILNWIIRSVSLLSSEIATFYINQSGDRVTKKKTFANVYAKLSATKKMRSVKRSVQKRSQHDTLCQSVVNLFLSILQ
jgi:hypothetical protein